MATGTHVHTADLDLATRHRLGRRAHLLAGASVSYNAIEALIAITAGVVAGSVALVGFGLRRTCSPAMEDQARNVMDAALSPRALADSVRTEAASEH